MPTKKVRLDKSLVDKAKLHGAVEFRSKEQQIEFWAMLGEAVSRQLGPRDLLALHQGFLTLSVVPIDSGKSNETESQQEAPEEQ